MTPNLPPRKHHSQQAGRSSTPQPSYELMVPTVLVVNDDVVALSAKSRLLNKHGYRVIEANTGADALTIAAAKQLDLVLLDVGLPDIDGFEVCKRLKAKPETQHVKVLQTSVVPISASGRIKSLEVGADAFLIEPAAEEELLATVRALLKLARQDGNIRRLVGQSREDEQRVQMTEALRESESKYRLLFDSIDEGFCIIEMLFDETDKPIDYRFLDVNRSFEKQTGITQAVGRRMRDIAPQHEEHWFEIYGRIAVTGEPSRFQNPAAKLGRFYDVYAFRVGEPGERKVGILFNDITERKRVEDELSRSRETFVNLVEHSPLGIYVVDSQFRLAVVSSGAMPAFRNVNPLIGRDFAEAMHIIWREPFASEAIEIFRHTLETGEPYQSPGLSETRHDLGAVESYEWQTNRVKLADGQYGVVCYFFDTTKLQQAQQAVRDSEARFRTFTSATNDVVYCMSPDWSEMRHLQGREFITDTIEPSRTWLDIYIHPSDQRQVMETIQQAIRSKDVFQLEHRVIRVDGSLGWAYSRAIPMLDDHGEIVEWFGAASDVTRRKAAEQELRESEEKLRTFTGQLESLVDERTKELVRSQGRLRDLATELNLAEQRERRRLATDLHDYLAQLLVVGRMHVNRIRQQPEGSLIDKLDEILDEALTYTRTLVAQLSPPFFQEFGLPYAFKWLAEQLKPRGLHVAVEVEDTRPLVTEDHAILLFQAARELLINVMKHAGTDQARLAMTTGDGTVHIEVTDEGCGFHEAASSQVADERTSHVPGFGLFSIRERMVAMGGGFTLVSRPGEGTRATLVAPLHRAADAGTKDKATSRELTESKTSAPSPPARSSTRIRVLLVDDHAMVRQGLHSILDAYADVEIVGEASTGFEAVTLVDQLLPSVVVMDINMPRMNGIEATAAIKACHPAIVVIGLSVQTDEFVRCEMLRAGASALMTKESAVEDLHRTIQQALRKPASV